MMGPRPTEVAHFPRVVGRLALVLFVSACGESPTSPTPPTDPTPQQPTPRVLGIAGIWRGGASLVYEGDAAFITLTLSQSGAAIAGTFECLYRCTQDSGTVSGTLDGTKLMARLDFLNGAACETFDGTISESGLSGSYGCSTPLGKEGIANGFWSAVRETTPLCVPELISPVADAVLDNGRVDGSGDVVWNFDWTDCPGLSYHLLVIGPNAIYPIVDSLITESSFQRIKCGSFIAGPNRAGWRWRVRAVDGIIGGTGNWSAEGVFNVEPENVDPPGCSAD